MQQDKKETHEFILGIKKIPVEGFVKRQAQGVIFKRLIGYFLKGCDKKQVRQIKDEVEKVIAGTKQECMKEYQDHTRMIIQDTDEFKAMMLKKTPRMFKNIVRKVPLSPKEPPFDQVQQFVLGFGIDLYAEVREYSGNYENRSAQV